MVRYFQFNFANFMSQSAFLTKLLVSVVWTVLANLTNSLDTVSLTTSFSTTLIWLYKSTETVFNLWISKSLISDFKLAKLTFLANCDVSISAAFFKSDVIA